MSRPTKRRQARPRGAQVTFSRGSKEAPAAAPLNAPAASKAPPFLVAAIGASAGGLEAFSSLLRAIPGEAPLALVLVQHLARDQKSILPELLGHASALRVLLAHDEQQIEPRSVYVIPPDARMTVSDGHLHVRPSAVQREAEGTVDALFRSIAVEYKERAIGVVLSGSAHDGASGITEIKAVGGVTMVQKPEQAGVDGMPRAAIATGNVDSVLTVEEIGEQLVRLSKHPFFRSSTEVPKTEPAADNVHMLRAFQLLRRASGIDFSNYKLPTMTRRIERRMALHRLSDMGDYVARLTKDQSELQKLEEELLIHVTSFFREPASYSALEQLVFPRLLSGQDDGVPIRFWVPGCSTGEEVYSLAMVMLEFLSQRSADIPLQIFGTDVSDMTIERARSGIYPAGIASDVSPERLRRFFSKVDGRYRINKDVRDRCVFARQDVTRDPPFSKLDLIVCRNLFIYLNQAAQRKVLSVFHYALRSRGVLMLGVSESLGTQGELFSLLAKKFQIYEKNSNDVSPTRALLSVQTPAPPPVAVSSAGPVAAKATVRDPGWDPQGDANRFLIERYAPPAVIVDGNMRILRSRGRTSPFLELPSGDVSLEILKMVRPELGYATRSALAEARAKGRPVSRPGLGFEADGRARTVDIQVVPLGDGKSRQYLVLFEEPAHGQTPTARKKETKTGKKPRDSGAALRHELEDTRRQLQSIIDDLGAANEELQSSNEEVLSSNEELQSTNEELDTAKEEMQSTNEELSTLNDELRGRNEELTTLSSDLTNLLGSVQIPIVMVTRDLRIRRVTPAAEKVLNVIPSDIGRPIGHLKMNFDCPDLDELIKKTIDTVSICEREVEGTDGKVFNLQIRPYKNMDNRIDGAVVVLFDVSSIQQQAEALEVARATGEALISTIREPILVLDGALKVQKANRAFLDTFRVGIAQTEGKYVYDLGEGQWNIPALRQLLEVVLPEKKNFEGFEVESVFPGVGRKRILLDARRIESGRRKQGVILLILRDVTDHGP